MADGSIVPAPGPTFQRAVGQLRVSVKPAGGETVLDGLRQAGCLRARFPRRQTPGWLDIVTLNTSGGIAGGDHLDLRFEIAAGARASIAAQAAERFYRRVSGSRPSIVRAAISVAPGGLAEWLPQETLLFDDCGLDRRLEVSLAAGARFLGVETLVFGRAAMGETLRTVSLRDVIEIRRDGVRLLHDAVRLEGAADAVLRRTAATGGDRAVGTVIHVAPDAPDRLPLVRAVLHPEAAAGSWQPRPDGAIPGVQAAASAWNGMLIARIVAPDGAKLRRTVTALLSVLRDGRPLPRVWMC